MKAVTVEHLNTVWIDLNRQWLNLRATTARGGERLLDTTLAGGDAVEVLQEQRAAAAAQVTIEQALVDLRPKRIEAIRARNFAEAEAIREKAATIEAEVEQRLDQRRKMLAEIEAWDECRYDVEHERDPQRINTWVPKESKTSRLADEAGQFRVKADAAERRTIHDDGALFGDTLEELLDALLALPPDEIGPPIFEIVHAWSAFEASTDVRLRYAKASFSVSWRGTAIKVAPLAPAVVA